MTRVLSGTGLLVLAIVLVWLTPSGLFLAVAEVLLLIASWEYVGLARARSVSLPLVTSAAAAGLTCAAVPGVLIGPSVTFPLEVALMSALVALGAMMLPRWPGDADAMQSTAMALFPALYLGLPIGAMVAVRETRGREALFLLMLTIFVSDTAQYYTGRAFGRRRLAPSISPNKTVEGAAAGFLFGALVLAVVGRWWLPGPPLLLRIGLGLTIVALGIAGDLFESMLKRSAGVKDSSSLIPGHGGLLDRIDALLFAAPVYYIVLKYVK